MTGHCEEAIDTFPSWCACDHRGGHWVEMLEYLAYAVFLIAVFGCILYVMNSLESEGPSGPQK